MTILSIKNRAASLQKRQSYRKTEMGFETHGIASQKKSNDVGNDIEVSERPCLLQKKQ